MEWFKKHPDFLRKESLALSNNSNYKELCQCRSKLFVSHGNIIVRLNKVHSFPILVVYTDATPYQLPIIFPLDKVLQKLEVEKLSSMQLGELVKNIKPHIKYYYNLRHQNSSGQLCILERDNLDAQSDFYGAKDVLQRIRDWFAGHITNNFPPDSPETDFCSHFNFISNDIKLLYPAVFFNDELIEGDCYATLYRVIPPGRYTKFKTHLYLGAFLDGITSRGIIEQVNINLENQFFHEQLKSSLDLYKYPQIAQELIEGKRLLKAFWFQVENEPSPFENFKELIAIIGNGNYDEGIKRITKRCGNSFRVIPNSFFIGIRFLNRKKINEFQMFNVHESLNPPEFIISQKEDERMRGILERFEKVEAIVGEKITEETFHQRNSKRADYRILKNIDLNIFGVGAIGGEIADSMAKAGTGRLILFDNQILNAHNSVRHIAGLDHIGEFKVNAVAEILYNHNPFIHITPALFDLYNLDVATHLEDDSIIVSSVADDNLEGFINQQLVIANKSAFYVRGLRGGKVARIFRVIPGKDACLHCLSLYRLDKKDFIEIPEDPDYPTLTNECNNPIRPASAADLKFIASFASQLLINHLQNEESPTNHWIWSSEILVDSPIKTPYHVYSQSFPPHPNCFYCNHDKQVKVSISKEAVEFMKQEVAINPSIETGGVMAGEMDEMGNINITHVSGPGPKAVQSENNFEKDIEYCQRFLDDLYKESNLNKVYVGEWHSHPSVNNKPSGTDIRSLSEIAMQNNYLTECPVMIIFSNTGNPSTTLHPAGKRYYHTDLLINDQDLLTTADRLTTVYKVI